MNEEKKHPLEKSNISRAVGVSALLHGAVVSFFMIQSLVFPSEPIDFSRAVRVDIVDLPDKLPEKAPEAVKPKPPKPPEPKKPDPPKPKPPEPPKPKPAPPRPKPKPEAPKVDLDKSRDKQKEALNRLKAKSAIERLREEQERQEQQKPIEYKGAVLSPGSALTGLNRLQHNRYVSDFDQHVRQYWTLPEWLANGDWKARVLVKIDDQGYVTSSRIIKSSGNSTYDELVLGTVQKASPFPAPPDKFRDILAYDGITLGFPE